MKQLPRRARALAVLVLRVAMLPGAARAQYGTACATSADCTDKGYPHCYVYWKDETPGKNTEAYDNPALKSSQAQVKGVCTECFNDCDCAVNQYCGVGDIKISKESSSNGGTAGKTSETEFKRLMKEMELYGQAFEGLAIRSRCLDYSDSMPKQHCSAHVTKTLTTTVVEQKSADGKLVGMYRAAEAVLSQTLQARFCGKVNAWAPNFFTCMISGGLSQDISRCAQGPSDSDLSTLDYSNTAAVCPKWAGYRESSIGEVFVSPPCGRGDVVMAGGGYNFVSPAVDWEGVCVRGQCAVCLDGLRRCDAVSDSGIPQICLGGQWKPLRGNGMQYGDLGGDQLPFNVAAQSQVATAVFAGLCFALVLLNVSGVWLSHYKAEEEREAQRFAKHLDEMSGGANPAGKTGSAAGSGNGSNRVSPEPHFAQPASKGHKSPTRAAPSLPKGH
jgi:hypothetical protein